MSTALSTSDRPSNVKIAEFLNKIALFTLLDTTELEVLAGQLDYRKYLAGQTIFSANDKGSTMHIVVSGEVELFLFDSNNERVSLAFVEPGDFFGELALLDAEPRSASALAVQATEVLIVDRTDLMILVKSQPAAALDMMAMLGRRIREANTIVQNRVARNVNEEVPEVVGFGARLSDLLTNAAGSIGFVYISLLWFVIWIVLNVGLIPGVQPFDPFPFGLLTMVVSLEAIFLSLFVLISQNRQAARDKVRNDIEYEVNLKAEIEIRSLIRQVGQLQQVLVDHISMTSEKVDAIAKRDTAEITDRRMEEQQ